MTNNLRFSLLLLLSFILPACSQPAEDPKSVAEKYWNLLQHGKITEAEKMLSSNSRQIAPHSKRINSNTILSNGEATTVISTTITTTNPHTHYSHIETFDTILILQQGKWKIDITQSQIPVAPSAREEEIQQMAEELSESMQKNIDSIDEAMSEGMQLLDEALREGSKEMGDSLLQLMNELNNSMEKSIDRMKRRREQQTPQQQDPRDDQNQQTQPDLRQGEGMI